MKKRKVFLTIIFLAVTLTMPAGGAEQSMPGTQSQQSSTQTKTISSDNLMIQTYEVQCPLSIMVKYTGQFIPLSGWSSGSRQLTHEHLYDFYFSNIELDKLRCYYSYPPFCGSNSPYDAICKFAIWQQVKPGYVCENKYQDRQGIYQAYYICKTKPHKTEQPERSRLH